MLGPKIFLRYINRKLTNKDDIGKRNILRSGLIMYHRRGLSATTEHLKLNSVEDNCQNKIIYNEVLRRLNYLEKINERKQNAQKRNFYSLDSCEPVCLEYLTEENNLSNESNPKDQNQVMKSEVVQFPYGITKKFLTQSTIDKTAREMFSESLVNFTPSDNEKVNLTDSPFFDIKTELNNMEDTQKCNLKNEKILENDNIDDAIRFGTPDAFVPISSVPCGGCGAFLHCTDTSVPGYLPKEVFQGLSKRELQSEICQRCHFLKEFNIALGVNVSSEEYPKILSQIKEKDALVILMIDLVDFPCSIWPGILEIIGPKPIFVVGNKIDLFITEGPLFLQHIKRSIINSLKSIGMKMTKVKHVALISAKTGFGVEQLINSLHKYWKYEGDVYLIGCTNVGKSTLFNRLIQSDYCKVKAVDLMQRATISAWPGTTLNLLKFPILNPNNNFLYYRTKRLIEENKEKAAYEKIFKSRRNKLEQIPLEGHIGKTFVSNILEQYSNNIFTCADSLSEDKPVGINPNDPDFVKGHWCYDTPGVVHNSQIINLLTTSELLQTIPKEMLIPRNFYMRPGTSLFIAGLARLDYHDGRDLVWFTVYASKHLPLTVTKVEDADFVYNSLLGTNLFRVPSGEKSRLAKWPRLSSKKYNVVGRLPNEACADIVLSSAGWISLALPPAHDCTVEAWTPEGRGIHMRELPVIPNGHTFRGKKIPKTPAFTTVMKEMKIPSISENPAEGYFGKY